MNYLGLICRQSGCPLFILPEVSAWTAGSGSQPQKSASGHLLLAWHPCSTCIHMAVTTAEHALYCEARAPLSNLRYTKGHADGSCHPLPDSLPTSTSFTSPWCPLPDQQRRSLIHSLPPPPPTPSSNLSLGHWEMPPCRLPSVHRGNGFWQPWKDK